jgi:hypothetical protein
MVLAAASMSVGLVDVFRRSATVGGNLFHQAWDGQQWRPGPTGWQNLGGELYSDPVAARTGGQSIDIFAAGPRNNLIRKWCRTIGHWEPGPLGWETLGDKIVGPPAVVSRTDDVLAIFFFGPDGQLYYKGRDDLTGWDPTHKVGGKVPGAGRPVAACSEKQPNRFDVFFVGPNKNLLHKQCYFGDWRPAGDGYENLGGELYSDPAVVSWAEDRIDVFAIGPNGNLLHKFWDGQRWLPGQSEWDNMGGKMRGTPTAVTRGPGLIDVVVPGPDSKLFYIGNNGYQWSRFLPMFVTAATGESAAASWGAKRIDLFYLHADDHVHHLPYDGTGWREPEDLGGGGL